MIKVAIYPRILQRVSRLGVRPTLASGRWESFYRMYANGDQNPGPPRRLLLAAVGADAVSEQILRYTRSLAESLACPWLAVYVETPYLPLDTQEQLRLKQNLALASDLGAEVITTTDEDVAQGLLRIALQRKATQIIVGKPLGRPFRRLFKSDAMLRRLVRESGQIDIHTVRVDKDSPSRLHLPWKGLLQESTAPHYATAAAAVAAMTLAGFFLNPLIGYHAIALIYLLTVVALAAFVGRGPTLMAATLSALCWDFFFTVPHYSLFILGVEDQILFGTYFVIAIVLGQLTARIRAQQEGEHEREERAVALYLLTRELSGAGDMDQLLQRAVQHTQRAFNAEVVVLLPDSSGGAALQPHPASTLKISADQQKVIASAFEEGQPTGRLADHLPLDGVTYVPLRIGSRAIGVFGLKADSQVPLTVQQLNLLDSFSQQIALALDRIRLQVESEKAKVLEESERLGKTLLNSMSHEVRTPLAAIRAAAANLARFNTGKLSEPQQEMVTEIDTAVERMNRLVGKVLDITRLESGHTKPRFEWCDVRELISDTLRETTTELAEHRVRTEIPSDLPLVRMDYVLMLQSLRNLLSNAAFHTPRGTDVCVSARIENDALIMAVADQGPGLHPESLSHLFGKFYRAPAARPGGTGLGLSLVKGFVEAQGGQVTAGNGTHGGAVFTIFLPLARAHSFQAPVEVHA